MRIPAFLPVEVPVKKVVCKSYCEKRSLPGGVRFAKAPNAHTRMYNAQSRTQCPWGKGAPHQPPAHKPHPLALAPASSTAPWSVLVPVAIVRSGALLAPATCESARGRPHRSPSLVESSPGAPSPASPAAALAAQRASHSSSERIGTPFSRALRTFDWPGLSPATSSDVRLARRRMARAA